MEEISLDKPQLNTLRCPFEFKRGKPWEQRKKMKRACLSPGLPDETDPGVFALSVPDNDQAGYKHVSLNFESLFCQQKFIDALHKYLLTI